MLFPQLSSQAVSPSWLPLGLLAPYFIHSDAAVDIPALPLVALHTLFSQVSRLPTASLPPTQILSVTGSGSSTHHLLDFISHPSPSSPLLPPRMEAG